MVDKIRQIFLSLIGIAAFGFVFYLVFKDDQGFMIILLATVVGIVLIILLVSLIGRIRDSLAEKRRRKPFKHHKEIQE
jgi:ABC-type Fe3+-siderophore transport system permease subunit